MVALGVAILLAINQVGGVLGWFILLPGVYLAAVLFDRAAGIYAVALSTLALYVLLTPAGSVVLPPRLVLPLALFAFVSLSIAIISAGLQTALERAAAAEQTKTLLLDELRHRTKNDLAMVVSMLSMQARLKTNMETRSALEKAIGRIQAIASAHEYFQPREAGGRVEMAAYLGNLCGHLGDGLRDVRPIAVRVDAAEVYLPAEQAAPLGLIVNELVTNALKHAFPDGRAGTIDVTLRTEGALTLCVKDNGIGFQSGGREGLGSRLTRLLTQQLGAQIVWEPCNVGCEVRLVFSRAEVVRASARQVAPPHVQSA